MSAQEGLDLATLQALSRPKRNLAQIRRDIEEHLEAHRGYLAFSTGKDSLVCLHLALQVQPDLPVVFFDSGLEYPQTYQYLTELAQDWDLNLHVVRADPSLLEIYAGLPSWTRTPGVDSPVPVGQVLIDQPAQRAHQLFGPGEIWGVRSQEAHGRAMAYIQGARRAQCHHNPTCSPAGALARHGGQIHRIDGTRVLGPIWDWSTEEVWSHIHRHDLPTNPVYSILTNLGVPQSKQRISHLIDAAILDTGAAALLARGWPALFNELAQILPLLRQG